MAKANATIKKDRVTPTNRYSLAELCEIFEISTEKMAEVAKTTQNAIKEKALEMGFAGVLEHNLKEKLQVRTEKFELTKKFIKYYNVYDNGLITSKSVNKFFQIKELRDIAHLINCFIRKEGVNWLITFSILQTHCDKYIDTGKAFIPNRGAKNLQGAEGLKQTLTRVEFENSGRVDLPQNEIFKQFKNGILYANSLSEKKVSIPQMTLLAIQMFMQTKPEIFGEILRTIDEAKIKKPNITNPNKKFRRINMYEKTHSKMMEVLQRWNMANGTHKNQCDFFDEAVNGLIDRMDFQYTNPEKFQEMLALEVKSKK